MCGIAGVLKFGQDAHADGGAVRQMCVAMTHRGPDDEGIYTDGPLMSPAVISRSVTKRAPSGSSLTAKSITMLNCVRNLSL
jgi:asparagine synthetase B (glutamine-hydrolysing)